MVCASLTLCVLLQVEAQRKKMDEEREARSKYLEEAHTNSSSKERRRDISEEVSLVSNLIGPDEWSNLIGPLMGEPCKQSDWPINGWRSEQSDWCINGGKSLDCDFQSFCGESVNCVCRSVRSVYVNERIPLLRGTVRRRWMPSGLATLGQRRKEEE